MESLPESKILKFNADTFQEVRKDVNLSKEGEMKEAVDIIEEWIKQQNHFTRKDFDRRYLESIIIHSKGSLERAKTRLDRACTLRTMMPNIFTEYDIRKEFEENLKDIHHTVMPRLTKDNCRVYVLRQTAKKFVPNVVSAYTRVIAVLCEYIRIHDYSKSCLFIVDYRDSDLAELAPKLTIHELRQIASLLLDCHGFRLKGIHFISNSNLISMVVGMLKQVMSVKVGGRVHAHKDLESIYKIVDKEILPKEYGGQERSIFELHDEWVEELMSEEHQNYCREIFSAKTDESKRQTDQFNEHYLGMPGSFRTLKVD